MDGPTLVELFRSNTFNRLLVLTSGAVSCVSYAPFGLWPLALVCIVALFHSVFSANTSPEKLLRGFLFGVGKFSVGSHWILDSLISHADANIYVSVVLFSLLVFLLSLLFCFVCTAALKLQSKLVSCALFGAAVCLYEILMSFPIAFSFPLLHTGYAFVSSPLAAYAPIGGVWLVGYSAIFSSVALYFAFRKSFLPGAIAIAIWIIGVPLSSVSWTERSGEVSVALVQANLKSDPVAGLAEQTGHWRIYERLTRQVRWADLVFWPESALPANWHSVQPQLSELADKLRASLILGTFEHRSIGLRRETFNVAMVAGDASKIYRKQQLVPFGEYTPDWWLVRTLISQVDFPIAHMSAGSRSDALLKAGGLNLKVAICYEVAYPHLVGRNSESSDLIVSLNADAWFGETIGPWQQLQVARMRAQESGRSLLRVSNVGPTAIISSDGSILRSLPAHEEGVLDDRVDVLTGSTPFVRYGLLPIGLLLLVSFATPLLGLVLASRSPQ